MKNQCGGEGVSGSAGGGRSGEEPVGLVAAEENAPPEGPYRDMGRDKKNQSTETSRGIPEPRF